MEKVNINVFYNKFEILQYMLNHVLLRHLDQM
jgi:hypothetical protein